MVSERDLYSEFNDRDGKRKWHEHIFAFESVESGKPGVIVWMGSIEKVDELLNELRELKRNSIDHHFATRNRSGLIQRSEPRRIDGGLLTHVPPARTAYRLHQENNTLLNFASLYQFNKWLDISYQQAENPCGKYWVGISSFPLPEDWTDYRSFWPGWTHVFHANRREESLEAYGFVKDYVQAEGGYPANPRQLSRELAKHLGSTFDANYMKSDRISVQWQYPWMNSLLKFHPLSGMRIG